MDEELDKLTVSLPIIKDNRKFLLEVKEYISTRIETQNPHILREQIAIAYSYIGYLIGLKNRSEALYRIAQKQCAQGMSKEFKAAARESVINGETAHFRYVRDMMVDYLEKINDKLVSSRAILTSLDNELRRMPHE